MHNNTSLEPALWTLLRRGYGWSSLRRDLSAGLTVAVVALPLSMALAIASGSTPEKGLHTAIVAGFLISALGGSRVQIGGPTGAFIPVIHSFPTRRSSDSSEERRVGKECTKSWTTSY